MSKTLLPILAMLACLGSGVALAHGPTRQKVSESITLDAPPDKVWGVISSFHDMSWDPDVASTTGDGGNTPNSFRTLHMKAGGELVQQLDRYSDEKRMYSIFMPHNDPKTLPVADFSSQISVEPAEGGKSTVEYRAAAYRGDPNGDPPPDLNDATAVKAMKAYVHDALEGLRQKVGSGS